MIGLIRISAVSEELGISERTVTEWISKGILRPYRVGRLVFLDPKEIFEDLKAYAKNSPAMSGGEDLV